MIDQLIIGDKASFDDFGASLAKPIKKNPPKKKSIKESVPFSNITHDFSAINGEVYWEERELECVFEITAPTPEQLEELKTAFADWVMNVSGAEIHDPYIPDYHFLGTYDDMEWDDDDSGEKTTATVTFTAYPYKIANAPRVFDFVIPANSTENVYVQNASSHRISPTITTDGNITLTVGGNEYSMGAGTYKDATLMLAAGLNSVVLKNANSKSVSVQMSFFEEVF